MRTHVKRARIPVDRRWGCMRSIHPDRARDEDLRFLLRMSRASLRVAGAYIDKMLGTA